MVQRPFDPPTSREARRATAALLDRVTARHRRTRRLARFRLRISVADLAAAMATYTGVTVAAILGAIYGISAAVGTLAG